MRSERSPEPTWPRRSAARAAYSAEQLSRLRELSLKDSEAYWAEAAGELIAGDVSKNLIHVFHLRVGRDAELAGRKVEPRRMESGSVEGHLKAD